MKILYVNTSQGFVGGVERYIHSVAGLLSDQHEALGLFEHRLEDHYDFSSVFQQTFLYNELDEDERKNLAEETDVAFLHKISDPGLLEWLVDNFKTILMVHDHDYYCLRHHKYYPFFRINCKRPFQPVVCSLCSGLIEKRGGRIQPIPLLKRMQILKLARQTDRQIILSEFMRQNLLKNDFAAENIQKIHPFYQIQKKSSQKASSNSAQLLYVGQIIRGKGLDQLIESLHYLKNPYTLSIIGKGNDTAYIQSLIQKYNLEKRVCLEGWKSNVDEYYSKSDLLIVPSRWQEPFGLIGMEAFAHQLPVVGFDVGGISEWLHDEENGYLVEPGDSKAMAQKIDKLISNPELRKKMGQTGFELVKTEYNQKKFVERFNKLLKELDA
ncbi:MAG: glycosyltransferase family 4 protein [Candidatus Marinimicrobia bacterium]|nr:glycosyltransferase family 4 protein [Candidatus Neomarinimicrobiota bacterium]